MRSAILRSHGPGMDPSVRGLKIAFENGHHAFGTLSQCTKPAGPARGHHVLPVLPEVPPRPCPIIAPCGHGRAGDVRRHSVWRIRTRRSIDAASPSFPGSGTRASRTHPVWRVHRLRWVLPYDQLQAVAHRTQSRERAKVAARSREASAASRSRGGAWPWSRERLFPDCPSMRHRPRHPGRSGL
jgi:hypothetical protein